jgi:uncharacterized protein
MTHAGYGDIARERAVYIDTSAFAKRYVVERGSEEVTQFLREHENAFISRLVELELRCLLARKVRNGEITAHMAHASWEEFATDMTLSVAQSLTVEDDHYIHAMKLIGTQREHGGLRSLDAIHLAVAQTNDISDFFTADHALATSARAIGFNVKTLAETKAHEQHTRYYK